MWGGCSAALSSLDGGMDLFQIFAGTGQGEPPVFDSFGSDQPVPYFLDLLPLAFYHQDLQAIVFIHMDVQGGKDRPVVIMLQLGQYAGELPGMMGVDEGNGPDHFLFSLSPLLGHQAVADQVPDGLGPVLVPF